MILLSGLNVTHVFDAATAGEKSSYTDVRDKTTKFVAFQLDRYLRTKQPKSRDLEIVNGNTSSAVVKCNDCCCASSKGVYLTAVYLLVKLLYLLNAVGQLFLLDVFLGKDFHFFGFEVAYQIIQGRKQWSSNMRFPKVTLCNFQVRHQTQAHKYILQCALPLNIFNEKLFIFIWFWFAMLSIVATYSFLWWCVNLLNRRSNYTFIRMLVKYKFPKVAQREKDKLVKFYVSYLQRDGVFIIRLLEQVTGVITSAEVVCHLWNLYDRKLNNNSASTSDLTSGLKTTSVLQSLTSRLGSSNNLLRFKEEI